MRVANWGNYPSVEASLVPFYRQEELADILGGEGSLIARGLGRCYGDSALAPRIVSALAFNRMIAFDEQTGVLTCEAGVSLREILELFVPRGFFLPVTPGTKFVTVGGAIASDVHGKNHHKAGSMSAHVVSMDVMFADGSVVACSRDERPDLFWATCGGMGLTGIIVRASVRLVPVETAYIRQQTLKAKNLDEIMALFEASADDTYSVAWIDCLATGGDLGRSVLMKGEHAARSDLASRKKPLHIKGKTKLDVPVNLPGFFLNQYSVRTFNETYYWKASHGRIDVIDYDSFFYPLDGITNWNRLYGKNGFMQYQFVLPHATSAEGLKKVLEKVSARGSGSFLAVLKLFGKQEGLLSFPMEGYTMALDFPVRPGLSELLEELDEIVMENGGRLYLAKDARMSAKFFRNSYDKSEVFIRRKHEFDSAGKFGSLQSKRLEI